MPSPFTVPAWLPVKALGILSESCGPTEVLASDPRIGDYTDHPAGFTATELAWIIWNVRQFSVDYSQSVALGLSVSWSGAESGTGSYSETLASSFSDTANLTGKLRWKDQPGEDRVWLWTDGYDYETWPDAGYVVPPGDEAWFHYIVGESAIPRRHSYRDVMLQGRQQLNVTKPDNFADYGTTAVVGRPEVAIDFNPWDLFVVRGSSSEADLYFPRIVVTQTSNSGLFLIGATYPESRSDTQPPSSSVINFTDIPDGLPPETLTDSVARTLTCSFFGKEFPLWRSSSDYYINPYAVEGALIRAMDFSFPISTDPNSLLTLGTFSMSAGPESMTAEYTGTYEETITITAGSLFEWAKFPWAGF